MTASLTESADERICVCIARRLSHLVPPFLERREHELATLRRAFNEHDLERIRVVGHNLKSSAGALGFQGLCDIATEMEASAIARDAQCISAQIEAIARYLSHVDIHYE